MNGEAFEKQMFLYIYLYIYVSWKDFERSGFSEIQRSPKNHIHPYLYVPIFGHLLQSELNYGMGM